VFHKAALARLQPRRQSSKNMLGFTGCAKTRGVCFEKDVLCQGTTLVVPTEQQYYAVLYSLRKNSWSVFRKRRFVSGHDFSRADRAAILIWALAPAVLFPTISNSAAI
jgi:hypothetical protein